MTRSDEDEVDEEWHGGDDDSDDGYIPCPHCGETMLEAADHCPYCDRWITNEGLPAKRHPWWIVAIVLILVFVLVMSAVRI